MTELPNSRDSGGGRAGAAPLPDRGDEGALVAAARAGDQAAFGELARRHSPRLRRVLVRVTGSREAAQDVLQEALVRAWENVGRFEGRASFFTWLTRIAINESYRAMKRTGPSVVAWDDAVGERIPSWGSRPDEVFESREFLRAVASALDLLPEEHRSAVVLRDVEGLSTAEAAQALGIEEAALKSRLHRGRMALRRHLDAHFATAEG
ncbi:MAG: RNA polymerase sigma factor [Solirubrobacteraceae bacterium]